jgi:hypothetical protein
VAGVTHVDLSSEPEESAAIEFTLSEDEFVAAGLTPSRLASDNRLRPWLKLGAIWGVGALLCVGAYAFVLSDAALLILPVAAPVALGLLVGLMRWHAPARLRRKFRDQRFAAFRQPRRIEASADGLAFSGPTSSLVLARGLPQHAFGCRHRLVAPGFRGGAAQRL